jgi:mannosyltransferase OCH1-like enzyme
LTEFGCSTKNARLLENRRFLELNDRCSGGNVAYVLNARGGQKLIKDAFPVRKTTDDRISEDFYGAASVPFKAYCAYPELVKTEVEGANSEISAMGRRSVSALPTYGRKPYKFLSQSVPSDKQRSVLIVPRKLHLHVAYFFTYIIENLKNKGWEVYDAEDLNGSDLQLAIDRIKSGPPVDIVLFFLNSQETLSQWTKLPTKSTKFYFIEDVHFSHDTDAVKAAYSKVDAFITRYSEATMKVLSPRVPMLFDLPHGAAPQFFEKNETLLRHNKALISGAVSPEYYPLRNKALELKQQRPNLLDHYQHPGYENLRLTPLERVNQYADVLGQYRISLAGTAPLGVVHGPYIVAKHFEIPATGSVLLTDRWLVPYLQQYGMIENEHYIATSLVNLEPSLDFWLAEEQRGRLEGIAKKGHEFVKENFNLEKQVDELDSKIRKFHAHMRQPIPKKVHQIWIGSNTVPDYVSMYKESFDKHLTDFEYRLWTNKDLTKENFPRTYAYIEKIVEFGIKKYGRDDSNWKGAPRRVLSMIGDLMKYEVIFHEGGLYFDTKFEITSSFDKYIQSGINFLVANEEGVCEKDCEYVSAGFFGSIQEHPIFENLISESVLKGISFDDAPNVATGPIFFHKGIAGREVTFIETEKIYPFITWKGAHGRLPGKDLCLFKESPLNSSRIFEIHSRGTTYYSEFPCTKYPGSLAVHHGNLGQSWH